MTTARALARDALVRIEAGAYSHVLVPEMLRRSGLAARDRAFVTELVYGTLRSQRRLDELLAPLGRRTIRSLDPPVRAALRRGAYQLVAEIAAHAAVGQTVEITPARSRGYVNAVLRALTSVGPPWPEPESDAVALSYPDWLVERLSRELGADDARAALEASNEPATVTLRPNPTRVSTSAVAEELRATGAEAVQGQLVNDALVVRRGGDPARLVPIAEGRATPQDQASQAVVIGLSLSAGMRVLDVAAAPGGKASAAAELVGPDGLVVALDINWGRLRLVRKHAQRLALTNLVTARADARLLPVRAGAFDRVLVDAPCSGLGVLRRRPEARWRITEAAIGPLAELQLAMVLAAAPAVRPGGMLVYSVCTLTADETTGVAEAALASLDDFTPAPSPDGWRPHGAGGLILPQDAGTDGMFMLSLVRNGR
jgi:16S rRNA (cytosine967-C5)-methyltransferase